TASSTRSTGRWTSTSSDGPSSVAASRLPPTRAARRCPSRSSSSRGFATRDTSPRRTTNARRPSSSTACDATDGRRSGPPTVTAMLDIEAVPELRDPVLVLALSGWLDAGLAGAGALAVLAEQLESGRRFAMADLADHMDLQQHRPMVHLRDG